MKKRNFNPELFSDDKLAECGPFGLPLYLGLLCQADSDGKLEDRPAKIKVKVFPYFDLDINLELNKLASCGFIDRYEVDGIKVIKISNFENLGITYNNEKASGLPDKPAIDQLVPSYIEADSQLNNININNNIKFNLKEGECEGEDFKRKPRSKPKPQTEILELPKNLEPVRADLENWISYKTEKGKPYKPAGLKALLSKLSTFDVGTVRASIQNSMANNWEGLFPEKLGKAGGGGLFNSAMQTQSMIDRVISEEEAKFHG